MCAILEFKPAVADAFVVDIFALVFLQSLYHTYGYRQGNNLVDCFENHLPHHKQYEFLGWNHAA